MDADEIVPLTRDAIKELLRLRAGGDDGGELGRRQLPRWPFPGAVEIWVPDAEGREVHVIATLHDMGEGGVGVRSDVRLEPGSTLNIAVHQPEASFHGQATVRHCTRRRTGYHVGMEFKFD